MSFRMNGRVNRCSSGESEDDPRASPRRRGLEHGRPRRVNALGELLARARADGAHVEPRRRVGRSPGDLPALSRGGRAFPLAVRRSRYATRLLEEHPSKWGYLLKDWVSDVAVLVDAIRRIEPFASASSIQPIGSG